MIETTFDLRYNIAALTIAILSNKTPEQAFAVIEETSPTKVYDDRDVIDMVRFQKQGMTYREIGEMYGINKDAVRNRMRKKKKTFSDCHLKRSTVKNID